MIEEHLAALRSRALLPELLEGIFRALHVSDQLVIMGVSWQWRRLVIPIIIAQYSHHKMSSEPGETQEAFAFFRNGHGYRMRVSMQYISDRILFHTSRVEVTPYGISNIVIKYWMTHVPIDTAIYTQCKCCDGLYLDTAGPYGLVPLCSESCLSHYVHFGPRRPSQSGRKVAA